MLKKFIKIFAIVILSLSVVVGGTVGVLALAGVLKPEFVALTSLNFSQNTYFIDSASNIMVNPNPSNSTQLDLVLTVSDPQVISVPSSVKAGEMFTVTPVQTNGVNNGGVSKITAKYGLIYCETTVYVDVEVKSISISTQQDIENNTLINNTSVNLNLNYSANSAKPYGELFNYENNSKVYREFNNQTNSFVNSTYSIISGNNLAIIDNNNSILTAVGTGEITVQAKSYKTYQAKLEYESHKLNGDFEQTEWSIGLVDGKTEEEYLSERIVTSTRTFTIRDVRLTKITVNQPVNNFEIQDIYLYETLNLTYQDFGLKLTPELQSGFNTEDMAYRLKDVKLEAIKGVTQENNEEAIKVSDLLDNNNTRIGWQIKCVKFQDRVVSKTALKFSVTINGSNIEESEEDNIISTTVPINIVKNEISDFTLKLSSDTPYISNLNMFAYSDRIVKDSINLNELTQISFENNEKPGLKTNNNNGYVVVKYFIKDYNQQDYENRVVECNSETGEIENGILTILRAGSISIDAKAISVDENGEIYYERENDPTSYKVIAVANVTSINGYSTPLTVNVNERLTNVNLEFDDEDIIWIKCEQGNEKFDALRELQTDINLKISCVTSKGSTEDEDESNALYSRELLANMLNNGQLEIVASNIEKLQYANISYNIDPTSYKITASLYLPMLNFNPDKVEDRSQFVQWIERYVKFTIQLSDEVKAEYGSEAQNFTNGVREFNVVTARPEELFITSNQDETTLKYTLNDEEVESNMLNYNNINGYVMIYNAQNNTWVDVNNSEDFMLYADFKPTEPIDSGINLQSSKPDYIAISEDLDDITKDITLANTINSNNNQDELSQDDELAIETKNTQVFKNRIKFKTIESLDTLKYVTINNVEYIYFDSVKLTFIANDNTFKLNNQDYAVMQEIYVHLLIAKHQ